MVSANTLINRILGVKYMYNESIDVVDNPVTGIREINIHARPYRRFTDTCPYCMNGDKPCTRIYPRYDRSDHEKSWRALDWNNLRVRIIGPANRVECPVHGVVTVWVPWAEPDCNFTKDFDYLVAWLGERLSKTDVAELMMIDWETVGRCMSRVHKDLEPDPTVRYNGLVNIGIDETSYKKGHKYITVVIDHDRNQVVWVHKGKGREIIDLFFKELSEEQRATIKVVTGDGAQWISDSVKDYCPNATRCMDSFHVVEWINKALDSLRVSLYKRAQKELDRLEKLAEKQSAPGPDGKKKRGRPPKDKVTPEQLEQARTTVKDLDKTKYPLGKNPENLTENQQVKLELIENSYPELYKAYQMKEELRLILHLTDVDECTARLEEWITKARECDMKEFQSLAEKIDRNKEFIINTIRMKMSNARIEATNNKIKLIIRRAFGFRNIQHLIDMIMLICSDLIVRLPNRPFRKVA